MRVIPLTLSVIALAAPALAGKVWVVGPGPGQQADLQNTILLAQDGDVIIVKSGTYESIRMAGKSVSIIAEVGALVQLPGSIRVTEIGADKSIVLSGLRARATYQAGFADGMCGLLVRNCAGALTVQDGAFTTPAVVHSPPSGGSMYAVVGVENCAALSIVRSSLLAGAHTGSPGVWVRGNGSAVSLCQVQSEGARGRDGHIHPQNFYGDGIPGASGLIVWGQSPSSSTVFVSKSVFTGGAGGAAYFGGGLSTVCGYGGDGGHGIFGNNAPGVLRILECTAFGGAGGAPWTGPFPTGCPQCGGVPGQPIYTTPYSTCSGAISVPPTNHAIVPGTARLLSGETLVRDTALLSLTFTGVSGEIVELAISQKRPTFVDMPTQSGVLHIEQPGWRGVGTVPASGSLTRTFKLPNLKVTDPGATWFVQARFLDVTTGQRRLSNLHTVVEVDASY